MASSDKNYLKSLKWFSSWDYTSWIKSDQIGPGKEIQCTRWTRKIIPMTVWWLFDNSLMTVQQPSNDCATNAQQLSLCIATVWRLSDDYRWKFLNSAIPGMPKSNQI